MKDSERVDKGRDKKETRGYLEQNMEKMKMASSSSGGGGRDNLNTTKNIRPPTRAVIKMKKVQVLYYLTRNGQLEHPHFMEVSHLPNLPLRLKDVMDRLTALRKGVPSMYSWSCKRSYNNGYVWNDLSENDVISPADGPEYVLKGSEIIESCSERFQQMNISKRQISASPEPNRHSKRLDGTPNGHINEVVDYSSREEEQEYEGQEEYDDEEKTSYTSSTTPHSRCSRGVSTDELEEHEHKTQKMSSQEQSSLSPPSTTPVRTLISDQKQTSQSANSSRRFSDNDLIDHQVVPRFALGRNSVLLQLISCGSTAKTMPKSTTCYDDHSGSLHKGVVCKNAAKAAGVEDEAAMIVYMSENPRFGNLQSEEKEYFSGSIVEEIRDDQARAASEPVLKRSNSYDAERSSLVRIGEEAVVDDKREKSTGKGKCISRMMSSSKITKKR